MSTTDMDLRQPRPGFTCLACGHELYEHNPDKACDRPNHDNPLMAGCYSGDCKCKWTQVDWEHIDGGEHYRECPAHKAYEHDCWIRGRPLWALSIRPTFSTPRSGYDWVMVGERSTFGVPFCPYCGDELGAVRCECDEITNSLREDAMLERRMERDHDDFSPEDDYSWDSQLEDT